MGGLRQTFTRGPHALRAAVTIAVAVVGIAGPILPFGHARPAPGAAP
jgi:hypothetical protein